MPARRPHRLFPSGIQLHGYWAESSAVGTVYRSSGIYPPLYYDVVGYGIEFKILSKYVTKQIYRHDCGAYHRCSVPQKIGLFKIPNTVWFWVLTARRRGRNSAATNCTGLAQLLLIIVQYTPWALIARRVQPSLHPSSFFQSLLTHKTIVLSAPNVGRNTLLTRYMARFQPVSFSQSRLGGYLLL